MTKESEGQSVVIVDGRCFEAYVQAVFGFAVNKGNELGLNTPAMLSGAATALAIMVDKGVEGDHEDKLTVLEDAIRHAIDIVLGEGDVIMSFGDALASSSDAVEVEVIGTGGVPRDPSELN